MNTAVLFSGGKDSTLALYKVLQMGWNVKYLVSVISSNPESYMFHYPNIELTKLQAKAIGIPIITKVSKGEKKKELKDLKKVLASIKPEIDGIVSGTVESRYQKNRVDIICKKLGLKSIAPLWHKPPACLWKEVLDLGFEVIITAVAAEGLDKEWLGKKIDLKVLKKLKDLNKQYGIHLTGEGGEFETMVLDGPIFKKKLKIIKARKEWNGINGIYRIIECNMHC
jgi:predicted ATP pyrophosphatase (TIGR00289 family)